MHMQEVEALHHLFAHICPVLYGRYEAQEMGRGTHMNLETIAIERIHALSMLY